MSGNNLESGQKKCRNCRNLFKSNKTLKVYCSEYCREFAYKTKRQEENKKRIDCLNKRFDDKKEGIDFIICPICFQKVREISILHAKAHNFVSPKELANSYGLDFTKCRQVRENISGHNNPGYQHGGKYSPWSKNSQYHTEKQILQSKNKATKNSKGKTSVNLSYWTKKYNGNLDLAKEKYHERQSNGLTKMIKLYGDVEGRQRWEERQQKWQQTLKLKPIEEQVIEECIEFLKI